MHEVFDASKNNWEGVYLNYQPTGLGATTKEATVDGRKVWMSPLVKAKGRLRYSKGRMGKVHNAADEWKEFEKFVTEDEKRDIEATA